MIAKKRYVGRCRYCIILVMGSLWTSLRLSLLANGVVYHSGHGTACQPGRNMAESESDAVVW